MRRSMDNDALRSNARGIGISYTSTATGDVPIRSSISADSGLFLYHKIECFAQNWLQAAER